MKNLDFMMVLYISLIISIFCNILIRISIWKQFLKLMKSHLTFKIFHKQAGRYIEIWGSCIRCMSFWFSLIVYLSFLVIKLDSLIEVIVITMILSIFTMSLSILVYRLIQRWV